MPNCNTLDPLTRTAIRFGSDKFGGHLYTPVYHKLFTALREHPIKLLEIGIGGYDHERAGGLGLRMWAEYFPYATIVGLDIRPKKLDISPRVHCIEGSQTDEALLARLNEQYGPFDIVIDDGSHVVQHVIASFCALYPLMSANGIYAIEDTQTCFMPALGGQSDGSHTIFELAYKTSLALHTPEGYVPAQSERIIEAIAQITQTVSIYRNIIVFHRGSSMYPSNHGLNFTDPQVQAVYEQICTQDALNPAPNGALSRIDMLIWAGRTSEAAKLARDAADKYTRDTPLLYELIRMMEWAKEYSTQLYISGLLARLP